MDQPGFAREIRVPHLALEIECAPAVVGEPGFEARLGGQGTSAFELCTVPGYGKVAFQLRGASSGSGLPSHDDGSVTPSRRASVGATSAISTRASMRPALTHAGP